MGFRTNLWNYVGYRYSIYATQIMAAFNGKPAGGRLFGKTNMSCENESDAISNFCFWLNNGGLLEGYYAVKDCNRIDIYKYKDEADKTEPEYYQPERVNSFFDFKFFNTGIEYKGRACPAFKTVNINDVKLIKKQY